jgi:hypothetical protein
MAGYKRPPKVYKLKFADDDEFAGLEVRAKSVPLGKFLDLTKLVELQGGNIGPEELDQIREMFSGFADALVSWNLLDEQDQPVPATLDGLMTQDFDFVLPVIIAWMEAVAGVAAPLKTASSSGTTTLEASLPMAPLSPSPESSTTPS